MKAKKAMHKKLKLIKKNLAEIWRNVEIERGLED